MQDSGGVLVPHELSAVRISFLVLSSTHLGRLWLFHARLSVHVLVSRRFLDGAEFAQRFLRFRSLEFTRERFHIQSLWTLFWERVVLGSNTC
jgi:hypothetical protein